FFSSRRRHTRFSRDWSSDVCSSDLASGLTVEFPGFLKAYVEDQEEDAQEEKEVRLPKLKVGDRVKVHKFMTNEHETKPPARYTEIGRASCRERAESSGEGSGAEVQR